MNETNPPQTFKASRTYLGDGAYVCRSVFGEVMIYTADGTTVTNKVFIEVEYVNRLKEWFKAQNL